MSKAEDFAQELELAERMSLVEKQRAAQSQVSLSHCIDCGEAIPAARLALGGVCRCVWCQNDFETNKKRGL